MPMSRTLFLSRHPGAVEWARRRGLVVDQWLAHLEVAQVQPGDTVIGTLPIHLAAQVCVARWALPAPEPGCAAAVARAGVDGR
jgi:hypothetical protein